MSPPSLVFAVPALPVADLDRGVAFYEQTLGFSTRVVKEGFAALVRDEVELQLWTTDGPEGSGAEARLAGTGECWLAVDDLDALVTELTGHGLSVSTAENDWTGLAEAVVHDVDGNRLTYHTPWPAGPVTEG